ncbi:MAG: hypothetical protein LBQ68_10520 [Clostridiales bacterium]|jgi:hypothetical protein|nr:hypothetical protein [Clostridiales bacterium]
MTDNIWLVIWSLYEIDSKHISIIKTLTNRGIVNSVCGRGNPNTFQKELEEKGVWNSLVFPSVDSSPVSIADRVRRIIRNARLKPEYTLYVDTNLFNRHVCEKLMPDISAAGPDELPELVKLPQLSGYNDKLHIRLAQYKLTKLIDTNTLQVSPTFLSQCDINCSLSVCEPYQKALENLLQSSSRLNYTGSHVTPTVLRYLMRDESINCGCILLESNLFESVEPIVAGFYAIKNGNIVHMVFSNDIINVPGVDQWTYAELGYLPFRQSVNCVGELTHDARPPWINVVSYDSGEDTTAPARLLIRGYNELKSIAENLVGADNLHIETEFFDVPTSITYATYCLKYSAEQNNLLKSMPLLGENVFSAKMFSGEYDYVLISILSECEMQKFMPRRSGTPPAYLPREYLDKMTGSFFNKYENYVYSDDDFEDALREICGSLPQNTSLVIMTAPETEFVSHSIKEQELIVTDYQRRFRYNIIAEDIVREFPNAYLLDIRPYYQTAEDFGNRRADIEAAKVLCAIMGVEPIKVAIATNITDEVESQTMTKEETESKPEIATEAESEAAIAVETKPEAAITLETKPEVAVVTATDSEAVIPDNIKSLSNVSESTETVNVKLDHDGDQSVLIYNIFKIMDAYLNKNPSKIELRDIDLIIGDDIYITCKSGSLTANFSQRAFDKIVIALAELK